MCGIVGFQGEFEPGLIDRMSAAVAHRGPDGVGSACLRPAGERAPVTLGHRRLAIIDLSDEGRQPMTVRCPACGAPRGDELVLSYNGEIYNFRELRAELEAAGHVFHSGTDSEVLLHLYAVHGPAMLRRLNGIFAFALYDGRRTGRPDGVEPGDVLLARDPLGVKPLYYAEAGGGVLFASELKALLQCDAVPRELDPVALHYQLAYLWIPAPHTPLRAIRKAPPGHALLLRGGRVRREWAYYRLPPSRARRDREPQEIAEELASRVRQAVRRQMVSDVPVGAFLSGGLDSSAVVAMMRDGAGSARPACYSIGFADDQDLDGSPADLPYARRVAEHLDADLRVLEVRPDMIGHLRRMLWFLDEPQADPAPINALLIAERARRDGVKVLLSGAGGDDIFAGYRRHRALTLDRRLGRLPRPVRRTMAGWARQVAREGGAAGPRLRRATKFFQYCDLPADQRMVSYFWWSDEATRRSLYAPALSAALASADTAAPLLESLRSTDPDEDPLHRMLHLECRHFLADHNLAYTDRAGMAAGVEVRVPLLDLELVEFAATIPPELKQRGGEGKAIFKQAMRPFLPRDVIYREKTGFGAPMRRWLRHELAGQVEETLSPAALRRRGLFDPAAVRRLIEMDRAGRIDGAYTVFALLCLELWLRLFIDAEPV